MLLAGCGIACRRQALPSHLSTTACERATREKPTAMHDLNDGQETAYSDDAALVAGVAWTRQRLPFQASIKGVSRRRAVSKASPTATQACADEHESPYNTSLVA